MYFKREGTEEKEAELSLIALYLAVLCSILSSHSRGREAEGYLAKQSNVEDILPNTATPFAVPDSAASHNTVSGGLLGAAIAGAAALVC
jgi:hypothetical protein